MMSNLIRRLALSAVAILSGAAVVAQEPTSIRISGDEAWKPILEEAIQEYSILHPGVKFEISTATIPDAFAAFRVGAVDLVMTSREPTTEEIGEVKELSLDLLGTEGLAFAVHPSYPIKKLTRQQLCDLLHGKTKSWKELGGPDKDIVRVCRRQGRADWAWLLDLCGLDRDARARIAEDRDRVHRKGMTDTLEVMVRFLMPGEDPLKHLDEEPNVLACVPVSRAVLGAAEEGRIRLLELQGIRPTEENVRNGAYPFRRSFLLVSKGGNGEAVRDFVKFLQEPEGQRIVARHELVPVRVEGP